MRPEPIKPGIEEGMPDILRRYEEQGATNQFAARPAGMIHCYGCGAEEPAAQAPMVALHRFEGTSDPGSQAAAVVLECPSCGKWGTMVFTYGTGTPPEEAEVLAALLDDRDQSHIESGK